MYARACAWCGREAHTCRGTSRLWRNLSVCVFTQRTFTSPGPWPLNPVVECTSFCPRALETSPWVALTVILALLERIRGLMVCTHK